jgi:hypothetical protein
MKILDTIISHWNIQTIGFFPPYGPVEVMQVFESLGSCATSDVVELYSKIGGMQEMDDIAYWRLWSLAEIVDRNLNKSTYGVLFSDHLTDSWCYRLKPEMNNKSSVYIDYFDEKTSPVILFTSLEEFLLAYSKDPLLILGGK